MFGISRENPGVQRGAEPEEVEAQNIDLADATITRSVEVARSPQFAEKLRKAIESHLERYTPLPDGFSLIFHNTEPQFDWGGWLPPARPVKTTTAVLQYDLGQGTVSNVITQKEITKRNGWGPTGEKLSSFVDRAYELAYSELDNVRYMRDLDAVNRTTKLCDRIRELLRENGIVESPPNAIQHPGYATAHGVVPVIHVTEEKVEEVATLLTEINCEDAGILPSQEERLQNNHRPSSVGGRVLLYDTTPILVFPDAELSCFRKTEPSVYRTPDLLDFHPDAALKEALKDCLKDEFDVARKEERQLLGRV